jgi:D-glycero-alpha-D-manno-heptose-7-phosphate kinase
LKEQNDRTKQDDAEMVQNLHYVKELGHRSLEAIESGNLTELGHLMHTHWQHKKKRSKLMSNPEIDGWYDLAMANGAIGGKLIGAGGGGFLLFYTEEKGRLRNALRGAGLMEVPVTFDYEGTKIL